MPVRTLASLAMLAVAPSGISAAAAATVRVNGVPLALQLRVIDGEPDVLARRLHGRWGERLSSPDANATPRPTREVLGRQRGPFHETLTLMPGPRANSTLALVAVQDLRRRPAPLPAAPLSLPAGLRLVSVVQFGDRPGVSALFSAAAAAAPQRALLQLERAARAAGWVVMPLVPGASFAARLGQRELTVVATPAVGGARLQLLEATGAPEQRW